MPSFSIPPPLLAAELPATVLSVKVSVPWLSIPPPLLAAELLVIAQLVKVSVASFSIPPPLAPEDPSSMVNPEMVMAPLWTSKTR